MRNTGFSPLCAYSYAWRAGYKPQAFDRLEPILIVENTDPRSEFTHVYTDIDLIEQIIDSFGKLGFLFYSRDRIQELNGKVRASHVYVHFYLYNFIYDSKAYLDSIAVMLNDFYQIGERGGKIDFKYGLFRNKVIENEPRLTDIINELEPWFIKVYNWRRDLIHRFSSPVGWHLIEVPTQEEMDEYLERSPPNLMLVEPQPYFSANFPELNKKYGTSFQEIDPFCEEWISNACNFYEHVCDVIANALARATHSHNS